MTESTQITLSSPKSLEVSSEKFQKPVSLSYSFRESSEPSSMVLGLNCKSRKRKVCPPFKKEISGSKNIKQTQKSRSLSLESVLKGKVLSGDQLKKKEMLEISISVSNGERMSLSRYLHESGFSYESQSAMVSVKNVKKNMINYLAALFFKESENPLKDHSLDEAVLRRISNRWGVIQDIVKDTTLKISAEEATLSMLKNPGAAYESMVLFLDLFERSVCSNREGCERKSGDQKYEDIRYPLSETQLISDVLEIAKGGHVGLKEFIKIFRRPSTQEVSEWEQMKASVWERMDEKSNLSEEVLLDYVRKCLKSRGGGKNKQALMACLMNSNLELDGKKETLLNFLRSESGGNLSTVDAMYLLVRCIGTDSGSKNMEAFVACLTQPELDLNGESVSLYTFSRLEAGLSASDAIHFLAKCVGARGAFKNKQALVECLRHPEVGLGGKKVSLYTFLKLESGFSASDAIHLLARCVGADGGAKNKQAFVECLSLEEIDCDGKKVPLYAFLTSKQGGSLRSIEAIGLIVRLVANCGGSKNKQAFVDCLNQAERDLEGGTVYAFLNSKCGLSATETIDSIVKCIGTDGGCSNKQAFMECLSRAEIDLGGKKVPLYAFLTSKQGCGLKSIEAIRLIVRLVANCGGSKNKQALIDCFSHPEIDLNGEGVALYTFLTSKQGVGLKQHEAIWVIVRFVANHGGSKNKQAFVECISQAEGDLGGETVYAFLNSKCGLSAAETINIIVKCIGTDGGCKNKQAFLECFNKEGIVLNGEQVSLYAFLLSERGGCLSVARAIHFIEKCVGQGGGSKNKQALMECFIKPELDLNGKKVPLYTFLCSKKGGGWSVSEAIRVIVRCIGSAGGAKNKQALVDCFSKLELDLDRRKVSLYDFLISPKGAALSTYVAIQVLERCMGIDGGSKNKQAFVEFLKDLEFHSGDKKVSVYEYLKSDCGLATSEAIQVIVKCIGFYGGGHNYLAFKDCFKKRKPYVSQKNETIYELLQSKQGGELNSLEAIWGIAKVVGNCGGAKNKQAFVECLSKPEINLNGKRVSLLKFLISKQGGSLSYYEAMQVIVTVVGNHGGSKNKQAFLDCLSKPDIEMNGMLVSLYTFLSSKQGGAFNSFRAIQVVTKCVGCRGGRNNMSVLKACFNQKLKDVCAFNKSLYELFLSGNLNTKEAISLCLIFSINRCVLNAKDVFCLFNSKEGNDSADSVIGLLNSLGVSCYTTLLNLVTKVLNCPNMSTNAKKGFLTLSCQSLVYMFLSKDGFFNQKIQENPRWSVPDLAKRCIHACDLYKGKDIHHELRERESLVVAWIRSFADGYQLTEESVAVITSVQCLDDLKGLIALSNREIEKGRKKDVDGDYCEDCLMASLQILISCKQPTIQAILKYESMLLSWFDLKQLSELITTQSSDIKIDKLIEYLFENRKKMGRMLPSINLKKSFLIYMKLSNLTPLSLQPLRLDKMQSIFESIGNESVDEMIQKNSAQVYALYAIYARLDVLGEKACFHKIMDGLPKIFMSYTQFRRRYLNKIQKTDWTLLNSLIKKWNLEKENVTQEELSFLIRIGYQLPKDIVSNGANLSRLENTEKGCCVLNPTTYPNWVFALFYFQKVNTYLSEQCSVIKQKDHVIFESCNDSGLNRYRFPLFKVDLHRKGFVFEGESIEDVACFYAQSGLDGCFTRLETDVMKTTEAQNLNPSSDKLEALVSEAKTRKRKGATIEAEWQQSKKIRLFSRQEITHLYETVSREERLTDKNCEIFMQGACYLSETMLDVLTKKLLVIEIGDKDIQERWQAFVDRYEKQKIEKVLEMIENSDVMKGLGCAFPEGDENKEYPMFSQLDEDFMCLFPEKIEDKDIDLLPLLTVDSLFDF